MKLVTPKIDKRGFADLLRQSQSLAQFYTPEWIAGQDGDPGQALLNLYLHLQEQILSRLNRAPDKNFVAFLDMMGLKLLSAQSAQAAVSFTLANGAVEHVVVPKGSLLSGQAADGSGEVIFQTQKELRVTPAILQSVFSYDVSEDNIYEHTQDEKEPKPFTVFAGENKQEHSFYLGHANLFNQKKPTKIEVDFVLAETASDASALAVVWEYFDGERWATITRFEFDEVEGAFDEDDGTELFTKSGVMTLEKRHTAEIAETKVNGIKNRWIRCRLARKLQGSVSIQLPIINTILISANPLESFAPDLAFNNDIPLNLEEISAKMKAIKLSSSLSFAQKSPDSDDRKIIYVNYPPLALKDGDFLKLDNSFDGVEIREIDAIVGNKVTLNEPLRFDYEAITTSSVALHTALRPKVTTVKVESLKGLEVSQGSKVTLHHRGKKEFASLTAISNDKTRLGLQRSPDVDPTLFYIEGDVVKITPKIKPFGELPLIFDTFYIASDEAFSKKGAKITLNVEAKWNDFSSTDPKPNPVLSWEYWNGKSWRGLRVSDTTDRFSGEGAITFTCPDDIEKVEVNGEEKFWIRTRIIDGDYGKEILIVPKNSGTEVDIKKGKVHFPIISDLTINYENVREQPEKCLTFNNLNYEDHTDDCIDEDRTFAPFVVLPEQFPGLFLGFDKALIGGPLSVLFNVREQFLGQDERLKMLWFYWNGGAWAQLNVSDETENLTKIGLLEFVIGRDFASRKLFGKEQFWLKGSVVDGEHPEPLQIASLHPNTTYALQADVANDEIAGSSKGTADQEFTLQHPLVISQRVFVREPVLPAEEEQEAIRKEEGKDAISEKKNELGETVEILITWHEVDDFDDSNPKSRHYTVDEHLGKIKFGDGKRGMVPPAGADNIIVSYTFGGGKKGNVPANAISGLKSALPFVNAVTNHLPADGGSESETLDNTLIRGPLLLKNRDRAVTPEDFESLAKNASRKVARAKCLPNTDEDGGTTPGWVTVMIAPDSKEAKPEPTQLLVKIIKEELEKHSVNVVSSPGHVHVTGPKYAEVVVEVTVVPLSLERAAAVETAVTAKLKKYINPLTGGPDETGWGFGQEICLSDIIALIEGVEDVDHLEKIVLWVNAVPYEGNVPLDKYSLPFSGEHKISVSLGGSQNGLDPCKTSKTDCAARQEFKRVECPKEQE